MFKEIYGYFPLANTFVILGDSSLIFKTISVVIAIASVGRYASVI